MMNVRLYFVDDKHIITFQLGIKYCKYCNMSGRYAMSCGLQTPITILMNYIQGNCCVYVGKYLNLFYTELENTGTFALKFLYRNKIGFCGYMYSCTPFVYIFKSFHTPYNRFNDFELTIQWMHIYLKVFYFERACFQVFYLESACYM